MTPALIAGCCLGVGVTLLVASLLPAVPDLRSAVARLSEQPGLGAGQPVPPGSGASAVLRRLGERWGGAGRYRADLLLTGTPASKMLGEKLGYMILGLAFPGFLAAILTVAGLSVPVVVPGLASLVLAATMSFVPDYDLRRRADQARDRVRRTVCAYLELVALERAADAGPVEALERAAAIGDGPGFDHIRDALLRARLEGRAPWRQLTLLAEDLRVPELGDVADIIRLSGEDGAAVLPTLRARAASLRAALLQADVAAANRASERMAIPVALLGVAFMALLGFPAFSRILFG